MGVLTLEVPDQILQRGFEGDGIRGEGARNPSSTVRKEFWTFEETAERGLEATGKIGGRSDNESGWLGIRFRGGRVEVIDQGDPVTACDLEDLMLGVTEEGDVRERRRRS